MTAIEAAQTMTLADIIRIARAIKENVDYVKANIEALRKKANFDESLYETLAWYERNLMLYCGMYRFKADATEEEFFAAIA